MAGLRETKKARTRGRIADEATRLFVTRGFDALRACVHFPGS